MRNPPRFSEGDFFDVSGYEAAEYTKGKRRGKTGAESLIGKVGVPRTGMGACRERQSDFAVSGGSAEERGKEIIRSSERRASAEQALYKALQHPGGHAPD